MPPHKQTNAAYYQIATVGTFSFIRLWLPHDVIVATCASERAGSGKAEVGSRGYGLTGFKYSRLGAA